MNRISIRLPEDVLLNLDRIADQLKLSRTEYIRAAVLAMNRAVDEKDRKTRMRNASLRVRGESMKINTEFGRIECAPD